LSLPGARDGRFASYVSEGLTPLQACDLMPAVIDARLEENPSSRLYRRWTGKGMGNWLCFSLQAPIRAEIQKFP